jgi:hypothetical protein
VALQNAYFVGLTVLLLGWKWRGPRWQAEVDSLAAAAAFVALAAIVAQNLFLVTLNNHLALGFPFLGVVLAICGGLLVGLIHRIQAARLRRSLMGLSALLYGGLVLLVANEGITLSLRRDTQWLFSGSTFSAHCDAPILGDIVWAGADPMPPGEVESLVRFLSQKRATFVVFDEFTLLYAMLNQPAPQPLLWFHEGLTYRGGDPQIDQWIADSLELNRVQIVIFEHGRWKESEVDLEGLPRTGKYLAENFAPTRTFGSFEIHERVGVGAASRAARSAD